MSHVKDFFQNVGSALTFGLIPPAVHMPKIPDMPKFEMPEMPKIPDMPKFEMPEMPKIPVTTMPDIPNFNGSKNFLHDNTPPDPSVMPPYNGSTNPVNPFR